MEEKPEVLASPEEQKETPKPEKSKTTLIVVGLVVVLLLFVGAVLLLSKNTDNGQNANVQTSTTQELNSTADLDKVSKELDSENLSSYEEELNLNTQDAAAF